MKRKKLKSLPYLHKKAWDLMSEYIRKRDLSAGCITCLKKYPKWDMPNGEWQAGHYIHRNSYDYNFHNINGQCKGCNMKMRETQIHCTMDDYRIALDKKWGAGEAEYLKAHRHDIHRFTRGEIEGIIVALKYKLIDLESGSPII